MWIRLAGLLVLSLWCSGCATTGSEVPKASIPVAAGEVRPVLVGTALGGSTRYPGAAEIVKKDTLVVFALGGYTRLQIGRGKQIAYIDLEEPARGKLLDALRKTIALCDSAKEGTVRGITEIDKILGSRAYSVGSRGLLEIAFSAVVLANGSVSCADILALKKPDAAPADQNPEGYAAIHAIGFSDVPHLIRVLEDVPYSGQASRPSRTRF